MDVFEWVIGLMFGAALLSMLARRIGLPYPSLLAVGGAAVALLPMSPTWTLDPQLALTLFVAPVLLDAAYDFSLRDLKRNWVPVAGLAVAAVGVTTAAVALVAREVLATHRSAQDLINIGAYQRGSNPQIDAAIALIEPCREYLRQGVHEYDPYDKAVDKLERVFAELFAMHGTPLPEG